MESGVPGALGSGGGRPTSADRARPPGISRWGRSGPPFVCLPEGRAPVVAGSRGCGAATLGPAGPGAGADGRLGEATEEEGAGEAEGDACGLSEAPGDEPVPDDGADPWLPDASEPADGLEPGPEPPGEEVAGESAPVPALGDPPFPCPFPCPFDSPPDVPGLSLPPRPAPPERSAPRPWLCPPLPGEPSAPPPPRSASRLRPCASAASMPGSGTASNCGAVKETRAAVVPTATSMVRMSEYGRSGARFSSRALRSATARVRCAVRTVCGSWCSPEVSSARRRSRVP